MINLSNLNYKDRIDIDEVIDYPLEYLKNSDIKKLEKVKVNGFLAQNEVNEYVANLHVYGQMYLIDAVTLEEEPYDFDFNIDDVIPQNCINEQNMLDIMEFLWQNIVLEMPIRYTKSDADNLKGDNWQVINEDVDVEEIDPRMQKLYDYYNKGGE
jgi:uncharacterized metal-binding protein YceD (DUF177 family)